MPLDPLVSTDDFAAYLQRDLDRATADLAVAGASGLIRDYCRWPITAVPPDGAVTFTCDGNGARLLNLPTLYLRDVIEVRVDGTALPADAYAWSEGGQLERADRYYWPARFRCIEADAVSGYDVSPDAVRAVALTLAARFYVNPEGLRSKTVGGISKTYVLETMQGDLTALETALLAGYRLP